MKFILYLLIIFSFSNCNNRKEPINKPEKIVDTKSKILVVNNNENSIVQKDTLIKTSEDFLINGLKCYWEHYVTTNEVMRIILKNYKTNQVLIDTDFFLTDKLTEDFVSSTYFNKVNDEYLIDINFDGFTDFKFESIGSNGYMSNSTKVYIFNPKTKKFYISEELSASIILKIDRINRILISRNEWRDGQDSTIIYFDKLGKIISQEVYSIYSIKGKTKLWSHQDYRKIVNGKIISEKIDSTVIE